MDTQKSTRNTIYQITLNLILILLCACIILPFLLLVSTSISNEQDIGFYGYQLIPRNIDFSAYKYVFRNPGAIIDAYKLTAFVSATHTLLSLILIALIAYPLSRPRFKYRVQLSFFLYFTCLFSGGLVPSYILMTQYLHLDDTIWIYIIPGLVKPWFVFMMRTFFQGIPNEISESAYLDGASELTILIKMIIPLSKPVIATLALKTFLGMWNNWQVSMLYINNEKLISLQYLLQKILLNIKLLQENNNIYISDMISMESIPTETVRMAMAIVVAGPALIIFPFFQKYFVKGLTVGSVKG